MCDVKAPQAAIVAFAQRGSVFNVGRRGRFEVNQNGFIANIGLNYRFNPFAPAPVLVAKY